MKYKKQVDEELKEETWNRVAEIIKDKHDQNFKPDVYRERYEYLVKSGLKADTDYEDSEEDVTGEEEEEEEEEEKEEEETSTTAKRFKTSGDLKGKGKAAAPGKNNLFVASAEAATVSEEEDAGEEGLASGEDSILHSRPRMGPLVEYESDSE